MKWGGGGGVEEEVDTDMEWGKRGRGKWNGGATRKRWEKEGVVMGDIRRSVGGQGLVYINPSSWINCRQHPCCYL